MRGFLENLFRLDEPPTAYFMTSCDRGWLHDRQEVKRIRGMEVAGVVYGVYDIIFVVRLPAISVLEETSKEKTCRMKGKSLLSFG